MIKRKSICILRVPGGHIGALTDPEGSVRLLPIRKDLMICFQGELFRCLAGRQELQVVTAFSVCRPHLPGIRRRSLGSLFTGLAGCNSCIGIRRVSGPLAAGFCICSFSTGRTIRASSTGRTIRASSTGRTIRAGAAPSAPDPPAAPSAPEDPKELPLPLR